MNQSLSTAIKPALFRVDFAPTASLVHVVRKFVSEFYACIIDEPDTVSRLALATYELLENATRYSLDGASSITIEVQDQEAARWATIRLQNRSRPENIERATAILIALAETEDPFALYQEAMRRTALVAEGSGLGLLRVCVEGEMRLRWSTGDDKFEIIAETRIGASS